MIGYWCLTGLWWTGQVPTIDGGTSSSGDLSDAYPWSLVTESWCPCCVPFDTRGCSLNSTFFLFFIWWFNTGTLLLFLYELSSSVSDISSRTGSFASKWLGREPQNLYLSLGPTLLSTPLRLQGEKKRPTLGRIILPLHKLPLDWLRRPVRPLPECRLTFDPISLSSTSCGDSTLYPGRDCEPTPLRANCRLTTSPLCRRRSPAAWGWRTHCPLMPSNRSPETKDHQLHD